MGAASAFGYIGGRRFDRAFFFGGGALAVALGAITLLRPSLLIPIWWIFIVLFDGPHLFATLGRAYLDPADRRRLGRLLYLAPLWLLAGPLALGLMKWTGSRLPWDGFLLVTVLWGYYHYVRQHYGILAIYERHARADRRAFRLDSWFLQGGMYGMFLLSLIVNPANRVVMGLPAAPGAPERAFYIALAIVLFAAALAWTALRASSFRDGDRARPALFVLLPVIAANAFGFFVVGAREPLFSAPANPEQFSLAVAAVGGSIHGIQYLGIVFAANRRRYARAETGLAARLGRSPARSYALYGGLSVIVYTLLNGARGAPGLAFFGFESDAARLFLGLYWGAFFWHYHLDQVIWHPSRDPALRAELGLVEAAA